MKGTVKWFNKFKNFGFITLEDGSKDVFVHSSGVKQGEELNEGDKVTFDIKESERGPQAVNVTKGAGAVEEKKEFQEKPKLETKKPEKKLEKKAVSKPVKKPVKKAVKAKPAANKAKKKK